MRLLTYIALLSFIVICSGCGTIDNHEGSRTPNPVYGGTRADGYDIAHPGPFGFPIITVVRCVDFPFSFAGDTVFLPVDLIKLHHNSDAELKGWTFKPFPGNELPRDPLNTNHLDKAIVDDYQDYINKNGLAVQDWIAGYYENGTGQHAVKFTAFQPHGSYYAHYYVLIYDKENKRIKVIWWGRMDMRSFTWRDAGSFQVTCVIGSPSPTRGSG